MIPMSIVKLWFGFVVVFRMNSPWRSAVTLSFAPEEISPEAGRTLPPTTVVTAIRRRVMRARKRLPLVSIIFARTYKRKRAYQILRILAIPWDDNPTTPAITYREADGRSRCGLVIASCGGGGLNYDTIITRLGGRVCARMRLLNIIKTLVGIGGAGSGTVPRIVVA